jgi:tetratricopeptide (TPR) repeat protein
MSVFYPNHPLLGQVQERNYGPEHVEVASTLNNLANAYGDLGDHQEKKRLLQRALVIFERYYGPEHVEIARILGNLANAYGALGDPKEQQRLLQRALMLQERHYGPEHVVVARTLHNLGNAYGALGDHQEKKRLLQRALVIFERYYGPEHVEVACTLNNLAAAYGALGEPKEAKPLLLRALEIQESYYGAEHVGVASTLNNLATAYGDLGDHQEKKRLLQRALVIQEHYYGPEQVEVACTLNNLAAANGALGEFTLSQNSFHRALRIYQHFFGEDHPEVGVVLLNLAILHFQQKEFPLSLAYLNQAHAIFLHHPNCGPSHPYTLKTIELLKEWEPQASSSETTEPQYLPPQQTGDHVFSDKGYSIGASAALTQKTKEHLATITNRTSSPINPQGFIIMPMPYEYALMSQAIYSENLSIEGTSQPIPKEQQLLQDKGWRLLAFTPLESGYRGGIWAHHASKEVVIAHKGSQNIESWLTDLETVYRNQVGAFAIEAIALLKHPEVLRCRKQGYSLSTTGHSLGGFLAQVCLYFANRDDFPETYFPDMSAYVFDSPGAYDFLKLIGSNLATEQARIDLHKLNVHNFCAEPTVVSTYGQQVGTLWHVSDPRKTKALFDFANAHRMEIILSRFDVDTGFPKKGVQMADWPKADYSEVDLSLVKAGNEALWLAFDAVNWLYKNTIRRAAGFQPETPSWYNQFRKHSASGANLFNSKRFRDRFCRYPQRVTTNHALLFLCPFFISPIKIQKLLISITESTAGESRAC